MKPAEKPQRLQMQAGSQCSGVEGCTRHTTVRALVFGLSACLCVISAPSGLCMCLTPLTALLAGPQLLQSGGGPPLRSTQTAKPVLYALPDCLYTIPASKPCSGPSSVGCSVPGSCTANQLPGGCCQLGFKCTRAFNSIPSVTGRELVEAHSTPAIIFTHSIRTGQQGHSCQAL